VNLKYFHKVVKRESSESITDSKLQPSEKETISYSVINSSEYNADVSMTSAHNKELVCEEELVCKINRKNEISKSARKESVDSYDVYIVRNENNNNHFYNYEDIFHKVVDENKEGIEYDKKSNRSLKQRRRKNVAIYISEQEEKTCKTYKDEIKFIGKLNKDNKMVDLTEGLNKEKEDKEKLEKPCFQFCCKIY